MERGRGRCRTTVLHRRWEEFQEGTYMFFRSEAQRTWAEEAPTVDSHPHLAL